MKRIAVAMAVLAMMAFSTPTAHSTRSLPLQPTTFFLASAGVLLDTAGTTSIASGLPDERIRVWSISVQWGSVAKAAGAQQCLISITDAQGANTMFQAYTFAGTTPATPPPPGAFIQYPTGYLLPEGLGTQASVPAFAVLDTPSQARIQMVISREAV